MSISPLNELLNPSSVVEGASLPELRAEHRHYSRLNVHSSANKSLAMDVVAVVIMMIGVGFLAEGQLEIGGTLLGVGFAVVVGAHIWTRVLSRRRVALANNDDRDQTSTVADANDIALRNLNEEVGPAGQSSPPNSPRDP